MATALLDDELWKLIEPLLPVRKRRLHHPGRKRIDDRRTLSGILFVLRTGIAWQSAAAGTRVWLRHDLLASPPRMATSRRVSGTTRAPALPAPRRRAP